MVVMFFVRLANLSFLLVKPLAVIHYPTDRWVARRRDFYKVQTCFTCPVHCLAYVYDSRLIVGLVYQPNCIDSDGCVYP